MCVYKHINTCLFGWRGIHMLPFCLGNAAAHTRVLHADSSAGLAVLEPNPSCTLFL